MFTNTDALDEQVRTLRRRVQETEAQLRDLKVQLQQAELSAHHAHQHRIGQNLEPEWQAEVMAALTGGYLEEPSSLPSPPWPKQDFALSNEEYKRYGRQLIMPEIGLPGQLRLKNARVLIVGTGGLGCPAAAYLAGAGVGTIGLVDGDTVEVSNLHRQIAHSTDRVGMLKVESAIEYLTALNPTTKYIAHTSHLTPTDALEIFTSYDVVLDCTDHPTSRYLISDACILAGKPLVSASALRTEGQLTLLNNPPRAPGSSDGGPCYRCIFPKPPPAESVVSCGEGGILGPVVGVMGVLQALEAIKLIASGIDYEHEDPPSPLQDGHPPETKPAASPSLLLFSAYSTPQFRNVRLRSRRKDCASCSAAATITPDSLTSGSLDYIAFCGVTSPLDILPPSSRLSPSAFVKHTQTHPNTVLLDVRDSTQFELCSLPNSINIPWNGFAEKIKENEDDFRGLGGRDVVVVCKLGNDSQLAVKMLKELNEGGLNIWDLKGGLRAWRREVDSSWPDY